MVDEKKFNRIAISLTDFERAKDFLKESQNHSCGSIAYEALVFTAIVCYFRPFSQNEKDRNSRAAVKLDLSDFQPLTDTEKSVHDQCMDLRNKALAHAEIKYHTTDFDTVTGAVSRTIFTCTGNSPDLHQLSALIDKFIQQCRNRVADYAHKNRNP